METLTVTFEFEKETKTTYRFKETGDTPLMGTVYLQKRLFPDGKPPQRLTVTVTGS